MPTVTAWIELAATTASLASSLTALGTAVTIHRRKSGRPPRANTRRGRGRHRR